MSIPFAQVPVEIVHKDNGLTPIESAMLVVILAHRGRNTNVSFPSRSRIQSISGYSINTISKATSSLVRKGWLHKKQRGFQASNRYEITIPDSVTQMIQQAVRHSNVSPFNRKKVADSTKGG